jgi:3-phenylpropionate/trans-cinnamate dioxygenase ferredoxin reductase subunit
MAQESGREGVQGRPGAQMPGGRRCGAGEGVPGVRGCRAEGEARSKVSDAVPGQLARVVVAGAGLAGLRTVEELRARDYRGAVTLIGAEQRLPYDRPPLSKKLMIGELDDTTLRADLTELEVQLRLGETATGLQADPDGSGGVLHTDRGEHPFGALVIATGAHPGALPGAGQLFLRTIDEALALRGRLRPGLRLAIVGAGWIGAELATAAAGRGCQVTVVEAGPAPLSNALGAAAGALTVPWYEAAGVQLRLGQAVESAEPGGLALAGGGWLPADEVVTAVGVRPQTGWLQGSPVVLDHGVAVDGQLRSSVPGVYAVGDCAAFWSARYQRRLTFEHWDVALRAPAVVAASVLGGGDAYDPVPYFWSEQFGRMVQYAGWHGPADRLLLRGDPAGQRWAACWLAGDRLTALLAVNQPRDLLQARRLMESGGLVDAGRLADPGVPVLQTVAS